MSASPSKLARRVLGALAVVASIDASALATTVYPVFDSVDSTPAIQAALNDPLATEIVLTPQASAWITGPLVIPRDDVTLTLQPGVVLRARAGYTLNDTMIRAESRTGIVIQGYGATIEMLKSAYLAEPNPGEWRHAIALYSCTKVEIVGLRIQDTGGDGVYVGVDGVNDDQRYCKSVRIADCAFDRCMRNGVSVISGEDVTIENCSFANASGARAGPWAGIDLEPNDADERLVGIVIRACRFESNAGTALLMYLDHLASDSTPFSIVVNQCHVASSGHSGLIADLKTSPSVGALGTLDVSNVLVENIGLSTEQVPHQEVGFYIRNQASRGTVTMTHCIVRHALEWNTSFIAPFYLDGNSNWPQPYGNVSFTNCVVHDGVNRAFLKCREYPPASFPYYTNVQGNFRVFNPFGGSVTYGANHDPLTMLVTWNATASPAASTVTVLAPDSSGSESGPNAVQFRFRRISTDISYPLAVLYGSPSGTATNRIDYGYLNGLVIIPPQANGRAFDVLPRVDGIPFEGNESLTLAAASSAYWTLGSPFQATATIVDAP